MGCPKREQKQQWSKKRMPQNCWISLDQSGCRYSKSGATRPLSWCVCFNDVGKYAIWNAVSIRPRTKTATGWKGLSSELQTNYTWFSLIRSVKISKKRNCLDLQTSWPSDLCLFIIGYMNCVNHNKNGGGLFYKLCKYVMFPKSTGMWVE